MPVRGAAVRGGARCVREGGLRTARLQHAEHDRGHRGRSSTRAFRCSTCHRAPHVIPVADVRRLPRAAARASRRAVPLRGAQSIPMVRARGGVHGAKGRASREVSGLTIESIEVPATWCASTIRCARPRRSRQGAWSVHHAACAGQMRERGPKILKIPTPVRREPCPGAVLGV